MPHEITPEKLAERYASSPFAEARDTFCAEWLDANCGPGDLEFIRAVRSFFWGPGTALTETEHITKRLGRAPSRAEVEREIARTLRILEPCFEAMSQTRTYLDAKQQHEQAERGIEKTSGSD